MSDDTQSSPARRRSARIPLAADKKQTTTKEGQSCDKLCCPNRNVACFGKISEKCIEGVPSNRWLHISSGEHFCTHCHHNVTHRGGSGNTKYQAWKELWSRHCRSDPSLKYFVAEEILPWWLQCQLCGKWRELGTSVKVTPKTIAEFRCGQMHKSKSCSEKEDPRAQEVLAPRWIELLALPALMQGSPALRYLERSKEGYYLDGVGVSPAGRAKDCLLDEDVQTSDDLVPFYLYGNGDTQQAMCFRPDVMEYDEILEFPEYAREQVMYLGIRNLIIALWNLNPRHWLTQAKCAQYIICRGLSRIRCLFDLERILTFLSHKGVINVGIPLGSPPEMFRSKAAENILVIGAGISGLAAARQLRAFGHEVKLLEARDRIGGRIWDHKGFGPVVGLGAHLLTGLTNNPITLICLQADIPILRLNEQCGLLDEEGKVASVTADQRADFHFNALLDAGNEWRMTAGQTDVDLESKLRELDEMFADQTKVQLTAEERRLLEFHLANLEYSCGAPLSQVSAINWDQNEQFNQFTGSHGLMIEGYSKIIDRLAEGLDVRMDSVVFF